MTLHRAKPDIFGTLRFSNVTPDEIPARFLIETAQQILNDPAETRGRSAPRSLKSHLQFNA
jgi:hypothetical protein